MLEALPYMLTALLVLAAWGAGLLYLDVFTPADVRGWRRLASMRGYPVAHTRFEKVVQKSRLVRSLQNELDLNRQLGIAARDDTPLGFLGRLGAEMLGIVVVGLALDFGYREWQGDWVLGVGPWIMLVAGAVWYMMRISQLRREARTRQHDADHALGDMLMLVGIMTDGRGLQLEDSVRILSRCVDTDALETIVDHRGWQRLVKGTYTNTIQLYQLIGNEYGIPMFSQLADAAANTNVGMAEREMFTRLAKAVYAHRLAEARQKAARAKILVTLPVAGMLIPLLLLLGAPTLASITSGLGG